MPDSCWATQSLDVTVATGISFWRSIFGWKGTGDYPATSLFGVTLGSTLVYYDSLTATTSGEITSATTGWENIIIDVSSYSGANDFTFIAYATADQNTYALQVLIDDVVLLPSSIVSATIEDSSKTWTADQFNTDGMFILTSGDVKGYSCTILDTFENYIQVPTTYANIINNMYAGDTYLITYTPTAWITATATVFTFSSECGKNATTLGTINYGDGGLTLEFVENIGTDTGLTWTIDTDVFRADVNQDYSRIASIVRGKGTKLCTGTVYSYLSDNTYALTVSTIGDTFLRTAATAGADKIYVYDNTHFGTAYGYGGNFQLVVGHNDTREILEISATGANGECTIQPNGVTAYAHSILEDVMNQGCFYATGTADEVNNFMLGLADTFTKYSGKNLSVFIGSEMLYLNCDTGTPYVKLDDNTVKLFMETLYRDDSYGYAYPHAPGSPVISALYFSGGLQNPNSMYARYGSREAYVNPVGIFDGDAMDKLCYHSLMSGTPNGTWGRVMMPASLLPSTVDIGDWVNIAEADLSATTCYQIVGLEYDQKKGVFWIELGSTEDYYLESIAGNRGTFDLSLSNY